VTGEPAVPRRSIFTWKDYLFGDNTIAGVLQFAFYMLIYVLVFGTAFWLALQ
jgi:hypothetical protein